MDEPASDRLDEYDGDDPPNDMRDIAATLNNHDNAKKGIDLAYRATENVKKALRVIFTPLRLFLNLEHNKLTAWGTIVIAVFTVVLAVIGGFNILAMRGQLSIMSGQLREMHDGGIDTHTLAEATKTLAETGKNSLILSQRAYLVAANPNIAFASNSLVMGVMNIGKLPSTNGTVKVLEMTVTLTDHPRAPATFPIGHKIEGHWSETIIPDVSYITPNTFTTPVPALVEADFRKSTVGVIALGVINYIDGFPDTGVQGARFCFEIFDDISQGGVNAIPCDPIGMSAYAERAIGYPASHAAR